MIREVCSCGAEFETDVPEQITLVKSWRRTHKHSDKQPTQDTRDAVVLSNTDIALGFQAIYNPLEEE
jgi:transcriptional regulator of acetoin/glycerol metabolism